MPPLGALTLHHHRYLDFPTQTLGKSAKPIRCATRANLLWLSDDVRPRPSVLLASFFFGGGKYDGKKAFTAISVCV